MNLSLATTNKRPEIGPMDDYLESQIKKEARAFALCSSDEEIEKLIENMEYFLDISKYTSYLEYAQNQYRIELDILKNYLTNCRKR